MSIKIINFKNQLKKLQIQKAQIFRPDLDSTRIYQYNGEVGKSNRRDIQSLRQKQVFL